MAKDDDTFEQVAKEAHELLKKAGGPVTKIEVQSGDHKIVVEWDPTAAPAGPMPAGYGLPAAESSVEAGDTGGKIPVTAPLVGTYYRSPEPGAKPFVEVGDLVEAEQEIGIIEAMKIMNRIVADTGGRVVELVVNDGDMVEFGQTLMLLEPLDAE
jgi:acetyl-CoA carboxylase biotin carboxyl carrier protein